MDAFDLGFGDPVYRPKNNPFVSDRVVAILNTSSRTFAEVWYVADASTSLTNWDGTIGLSGEGLTLQTFRIDAEGANRPLLYESPVDDDMWQAGEVWEFTVPFSLTPKPRRESQSTTRVSCRLTSWRGVQRMERRLYYWRSLVAASRSSFF